MYATILMAMTLVQPLQAPPIERLPQAPLVVITYDDAHNQAIKEQKRLAVFVGTPARDIPGVVTVSVKRDSHWLKFPDKSLVVYGPLVGLPADLYLLGVINPNAPDAEIRDGGRKAVSQAASPFERFSADDDDAAAGRWRKLFPFLAGGERYKPAKYTQEIAVTDGRDRISPVPRSQTEPIWHQPGGMQGVTGWRSDLFKFAPSPQTFIADISVRNEFGYFQPNRGYVRRYQAGTWFADVLSNAVTGKPFEVRVIEKQADGTWDRYVAFKSVKDRPQGYTGLQFTCAACHSRFPASGNYAGPLVPGSDGVFSDPVPELEGDLR